MTLIQVLEKTAAELSQASLQCADPREHAKQIVSAALKIDAPTLYINLQEELSKTDFQRVERLVAKRCQGVPFQYCVGYEWFWNFQFKVGPGVLIPRRETEHLVEAILSLPSQRSLRIAELGAGSGNIGISVLSERPHYDWYGYECNQDSIPYLNENLKLLDPNSRYRLREGNFFEKALSDGPFDCIVANPPYVASESLHELSKEVRCEPTLALDGGKNGMEILERLARYSSEILVAGGSLMCELGEGQATVFAGMAEKWGFSDIDIRFDYSGIQRVFVGRRK